LINGPMQETFLTKWSWDGAEVKAPTYQSQCISNM
jgi:hypothetical protein